MNAIKVAIQDEICKINIYEYSLDNYKTYDPEGYTIICRLGEASDSLSYFSKTSKIVLDSGQQSKLFNNFEQLVSNIAEDFGVPQPATFEKSANFFSNNQITVQPIGIQGRIYKAMRSLYFANGLY